MDGSTLIGGLTPAEHHKGITLNDLREPMRRYNQKRIDQLLEDTLGPNPCQRTTLNNQETGDNVTIPCDSKRCGDCGPRKRLSLKLQLTNLGEYAYIWRYYTRATIDQALERAKKQKQRHGVDYAYIVTGDEHNGWIFASTIQLHPDQGYYQTSEWSHRITSLYSASRCRIRKTRHLGRMSLVTYRSSREKGTYTPWRYLPPTSAGYRDHIRGHLQDQLRNLEASCSIEAPRSTVTALPDPY